IDVQVEPAGSARVRLTIKDTGFGIPADKLADIFEPFAQVSASDQQILGGAGLGLAIVRELVTRMDGYVDVSSEPGKGSIFTVEIDLPLGENLATGPADLLASVPAQRASAKEVFASERGLKLLVAEDNVVNRKVLLAMLSRLGHEVTLTNDGQEAWDALQTQSFDLLLTDIEMPGLTGLELAQRIREREKSQGARPMRIIGATAHVGESERQQLFDAGIDGHLGKPFTMDDLSKAIARVWP
ncbi:MAG: response regulator, partial [Polyangiaceae bacterium]